MNLTSGQLTFLLFLVITLLYCGFKCWWSWYSSSVNTHRRHEYRMAKLNRTEEDA